MIRAIIFDCFGVLITDALKGLRDDLYAKDPSAAHELDGLVRATNIGVIDAHVATDRIAELLAMSTSEYRSRIDGGEVRNTVLFSYILELKKQYRTAMLSNIATHSLQKRFTDEELRMYFDAVVTSGELGHAKPGKAIYLVAAERLAVRPEECVFIDDREHFVAAATSVGMSGIVYTEFIQFRKELASLLQQENTR